MLLRGCSTIMITVGYIVDVVCVHIRENGVECSKQFRWTLRV